MLKEADFPHSTSWAERQRTEQLNRNVWDDVSQSFWSNKIMPTCRTLTASCFEVNTDMFRWLYWVNHYICTKLPSLIAALLVVNNMKCYNWDLRNWWVIIICSGSLVSNSHYLNHWWPRSLTPYGVTATLSTNKTQMNKFLTEFSLSSAKYRPFCSMLNVF